VCLQYDGVCAFGLFYAADQRSGKGKTEQGRLVESGIEVRALFLYATLTH